MSKRTRNREQKINNEATTPLTPKLYTRQSRTTPKGRFTQIMDWLGHVKLLIEIPFIVVTLSVGIYALNIYQTTNRVAIRQQLYQTDQLISSREIDDPFLLTVNYVPTWANISAQDYIQASLRMLLNEQEAKPIHHVEGLYKFIHLDQSGGKVSEKQRDAVRLYLHSETYLYHLHNIFDYVQDGVISMEEAETWFGLMTDLGKSPFFAATLYSAHKNRFMSKAFAQELQKRYKQDSLLAEIYSHFYPELLEENWLDDFPDYSYCLSWLILQRRCSSSS